MKLALSIILFVLSANCNAKMKHKKSVHSEKQCIMSAVMYESGGEGMLGKKAVLQTIRNRQVIRGITACQVVTEKGQFSWMFGKGRKPIKKMTAQLQELLDELEEMDEVFEGVAIEFFHNTSVKPKWAKKLKYVGRVGKHKFYKRRNIE